MADQNAISDKPSTKHKKYIDRMYERKMVRDCVAGSTQVKLGQDLYLPIPDGMLTDGTQFQATNFSSAAKASKLFESDLPWHNSNKAYQAYLQRARFPELTNHTLRGLNGTATRKPLETKLAKRLSYLEEDATIDGKSLQEFFGMCVSEILQGGNGAIVVEIDPELNEPYLAFYDSNACINWRKEKYSNNLELSVFKTTEEILGDNRFESKEAECVVAYEWIENPELEDGVVLTGTYVRQTRFLDEEEEESILPNLQGEFLPYIPVFYIGSLENDPDPQPAPLFGIAEICISIYQINADLRHAQYMTCNPNLVISGIDSSNPNLEGDDSSNGGVKGIPNVVGSTSAMILDAPDAKAYYTKTDTSGLNHVKDYAQDLIAEAIILGASLVGTDKKAAEKVETLKLRQGAQGASLLDVVRNVAKALNDAVLFCEQITGSKGSEIIASTEFAERALSPQMIDALSKAVVMENISKYTMLRNMKEAGFLFDDEVEDELERLEKQIIASENRESLNEPDLKPDVQEDNE